MVKKYKIGDVIITNPTGNIDPYDKLYSGAGFRPNLVLTIRDIQYQTQTHDRNIYWFKEINCGIYEGEFKHYIKYKIYELW